MRGTEGDNRWRGRGKARVGEKRKRVKEDKNSAIKNQVQTERRVFIKLPSHSTTTGGTHKGTKNKIFHVEYT